MTTGDLGLSGTRVGEEGIPIVLVLGIGLLEARLRRNPTRSYSPPLRPPLDRFRDVPAEGQPNAADSQGAPKAAPAAT